MCDSGKGETFCERSKKEQSARKISRCARNDGMGGMGLFHVAYNGYVWKTPFPQRHPERSPRSFLHTGIASYARQRKRGKLLRKEQERAECKEDFSLRSKWRYGGMGLFHVAYNEYVWKALFLYRHPDRSGGIFLAGGDNVVCVIAEKGKPFAKGARKSKVQGGFLDCTRNDGRESSWFYEFEILNE